MLIKSVPPPPPPPPPQDKTWKEIPFFYIYFFFSRYAISMWSPYNTLFEVYEVPFRFSFQSLSMSGKKLLVNVSSSVWHFKCLWSQPWWLGWIMDMHPTGDQEVGGSTPSASAAFVRRDWYWNIFYGHYLLLIQEDYLSVYGERICTLLIILVNCLEN